MKVKILVAPLLITAIIVLLIWFIWPIWTNGSDGILEKQSDYQIQKDRQAELEKKKELIAARSQEIEEKKNQVEILRRFLPDKMDEEELVEKMQFLSTMKQEDAGNGWEMGPLSMQIALAKEAQLGSRNTSGADSSAKNTPVIIKTDLSGFGLDFVFIGPYERVREIVNSIYSLKRYNKVTKFKTTSGTVTRQGNYLEWQDSQGEPTNGLKVEMSMTYTYYNIGSVGPENINDPVFSLASLNEIKWGAIDAIEKKETEIMPLTLPETGRGNLFVLPSQ